MATERIVIIDTDASQSPHYTSLAAAIAGETGANPLVVTGTDLVSNNENVVFLCRASSGLADTSAVSISGFTTDSTRNIEVRTDTGYKAGATWDTSKYRIDYSATTSSEYAIEVVNAWVVLRDLQIRITYEGHFAYGVDAINIGLPNGIDDLLIIDGCYIIAGGNSNYARTCIRPTRNKGTTIINSVLRLVNSTYDHTGCSCMTTYNSTVASTNKIYNCTLISGAYGIVKSACQQQWTIKNVLSYGQINTAFSVGNLYDSDYNATDDDTATGGAHDRVSQIISFTDASDGDYSLTSSDTGARDHGVDLSSLFSVDMLDNTRSGSWDIGAFEFIATGGGDIFESDFSLAIGGGGMKRLKVSADADGIADFGSIRADYRQSLHELVILGSGDPRSVFPVIIGVDAAGGAGRNDTRPSNINAVAGGDAHIRMTIPATCEMQVYSGAIMDTLIPAAATLGVTGEGALAVTIPASIDLEIDFSGTVSTGGTVRAASIIVGANGGAARSDIKMSGAEIGMSGTGTVQAGMDAAHSLGIDAEGIMIRTVPAGVRIIVDHATLRQVVTEAVASASVDWPITVHQAIVVHEILDLISCISLLLSQFSEVTVQMDTESRITTTLELESRI